MQKILTIKSLSKQIYQIVDEVIKTGVPAKFTKGKHVLKICIDNKSFNLKDLPKHNTIVGDPKELVGIKVLDVEEEKSEMKNVPD